MDQSTFSIRRARRSDLPALGHLGALLVRTHHAFDTKRFLRPGDDLEQGYAAFLGTQLDREDVLLLVAEREGAVVGYVYAGIEPASWQELREQAGFVHDVAVAAPARRAGIAAALVEAAVAWCRERQLPRVILWTATQNRGAQHLFTRLGFRQTMIEMTRDL